MSRSSLHRPWWHGALTVAVSALLVVPSLVWMPVADAAPLPPCTSIGSFEIDGDMTTNNCGTHDWDNEPGVGTSATFTNLNPTADSSAHTPATDWALGGSPAQDAQMDVAYSASQIVGGDFYAYVGWHRVKGSGTSGFIVEVDQAPDVASAANPAVLVPNRSSGGYAFFVDASGSGALSLDKVCSFASAATYPGTCAAPAGGYAAATNGSSTVTNPLTAALSPMDKNTFVEIGLDLTTLVGLAPACPAPSTAVVSVRSYTGAGQLQQFSGGISVTPPSTCVAPPMTTTAQPGNGSIDGLSVTTAGSAQHDTVSVGTAAKPAAGSVDFYLCGPAEVTANGGDCSANGTLVSKNVTLDASGGATSAAVSGAADTAPGTYCWRTEYTPGAANKDYLPGTHTNSGSECFTVAHASPTIATTIGLTTVPATAARGSLGLTTLADTATLSGVVAGADLSAQKVMFTLWGPFASAPGAGSCTAAAPTYTETDPLTKVDSTTWTAAVATPFTPSAAGYYTWTASYSGDTINDAANEPCGQASESGHIVGASVQVEKTTPSGTITAGDTISFDISLQNASAATATGVKVTDALPALPSGATWVLDPNGFGCTLAAGTVTCNVGDFDPTGWVVIAHVHAVTAPADCGTIRNTATLTTTNGGGSGSSSATVDVTCAALTITKTADAAAVPVGSPIGYTVTVDNTSAVAAAHVHVTDPLPAGPGVDWSLDPAVAGCTITGAVGSQSLDCTLATLAGGGTLSAHVVSDTSWTSAPAVNSCGTYTNTATVAATNVATAPTASARVVVSCPALTITKAADDRTVQAGHQIGYTLRARNTGDGDATGALISDPLPSAAGVSWTIDTATGPLSCVIVANTLTCAGTLYGNDIETVHLVSATAFVSCGTLANTATLSAANDPSTATSKTVDIDVVCADLGITKTADAATVDVGSDIGYTITVTNTGSGIASGVDVTDPLPTGPGISWSVDAHSGPLSCKITAGTLECTGNLAAAGDPSGNDTETVHIASGTTWTGSGAAAVNSCLGGNGRGRYDNTASVVWTNGPAAPLTSGASTQVNCPDITFTKVADAASVSAGSQIGFGITITNAGPGTADGGVLMDPLPAGTGIDWQLDAAATTALGCTVTGAIGSQILSCGVGDLAAASSVFVHVFAATGPLGCGSYPNTATLTTTNSPLRTSSDTTTVLCPTLTLSKTADAATVSVGSAIGFTVTVTSGAAGDATDVAVADPLPSGPGVSWTIDSTQLNGLAAPGGTCAITGAPPAQTLACGGAGFTMHPSDVLTVHVTSTTQWTAAGVAVTNSCLGGPLGDGGYPNTATVTASNVISGRTMTDSASTAVQCPSIALAKAADAASVSAGDAIGYTVTASNAGPGSATGVLVSDPLPGGGGVDWSVDSVTINGAPAPAGTCSVTGVAPAQTLTCGPGLALASGDVLAVHVTSSTDTTSCTAGVAADGTFANTAALTATNTPDTPGASATLQVKCAALTLTKVADSASVAAGAPIGFTVTATNGGGGTARGVVLSDPLPSAAGLTWTIASADPALSCAIAAGTLTCTGRLAAGASDAVHITSVTTTGSCGAYVNTASVTWTGAPAPVTASAPVRVICPPAPAAAALAFTKTALAPSVTAGDQIGYTLTVADGSGSATDVTVTDPLPAGPAGSNVHFVIDPAYTGPGTCTLTGPDGAQVLTCSLGSLSAGTTASVRIVSDTDRADCGTYSNTATLTASNASSQTAQASTTVLCADDQLTVTADQQQVNSGNPIGFTLTGGNAAGQPQSGTAVAALVRTSALPLLPSLLAIVRNAVLTSHLPAGPDVDWSIDRPVNRGTCAITGAVGSQLLTCLAGDLAPGDTFTVHITSATTDNSCQSYPDTGVLTSTSADTVSARDVTTVLCVGGVQTSQPPPAVGSTPPTLATTGPGPIRPELILAMLMIGAGALALLATRRRGHRAH
jgi:uncharacterized repeat protein (TIGR01451 family)